MLHTGAPVADVYIVFEEYGLILLYMLCMHGSVRLYKSGVRWLLGRTDQKRRPGRRGADIHKSAKKLPPPTTTARLTYTLHLRFFF